MRGVATTAAISALACVAVGIGVLVARGAPGVRVTVIVGVIVGVTVGVMVGVAVGVIVGEFVGVRVEAIVGVSITRKGAAFTGPPDCSIKNTKATMPTTTTRDIVKNRTPQ